MDENTTPNEAQGTEVGVTIYSTPTCHYCNLTKEFLKENNVAYTDYNVAEDTTKRAEMIEKSGQMGVPVIMAKGEMMIGFNEDKLRSVLGL
jgi:glutaredoxin-like YruB-family protein